MGIQGLLPFLKDIHRPVHLRNYSGQTLAVDTYVWLHRGAFSCALELCTGVKTTRYVNYCMRQVQLLLDHGVKPLMVFDGGCLPMKTGTEEQRKKKREEGMKKGNQYLRSGDKTKAMEVFQGCVDVTPRMAYELIKELRKAGVEYIVAPYEADAQITYLVKLGIADAAVTEDSDLVVFECPKVVVKLDKEGNGIEICAENLGRVSGMELWTHKRFRHMCIMSGCDYLESPTGVGLKKAQVYLKHKYAEDVLKTWKWGRATNAPKCPPNYAKNFRLAELTFLHQRVYDPLIQEIVHLTPPPSDLHIDAEVSLVVGPYLPPEIARGIAEGILDPDSKLPFERADPKLSTFFTKSGKSFTLPMSEISQMQASNDVAQKENVEPPQAPKRPRPFASIPDTPPRAILAPTPLSPISGNIIPPAAVPDTPPRSAKARPPPHLEAHTLDTTPDSKPFISPLPTPTRMLDFKTHPKSDIPQQPEKPPKPTHSISPFFKGLSCLREQAVERRFGTPLRSASFDSPPRPTPNDETMMSRSKSDATVLDTGGETEIAGNKRSSEQGPNANNIKRRKTLSPSSISKSSSKAAQPTKKTGLSQTLMQKFVFQSPAKCQPANPSVDAMIGNGPPLSPEPLAVCSPLQPRTSDTTQSTTVTHLFRKSGVSRQIGQVLCETEGTLQSTKSFRDHVKQFALKARSCTYPS